MNAERILRDIQRLRVLVIGDVCLDRWCYYDPDLTEPSRETGIPRLAVVRTEVTPGAAGTIANNLVSLGVRNVSILGAIGDDGFAWELLRAIRSREIAPDLLVQSHFGVDLHVYQAHQCAYRNRGPATGRFRFSALTCRPMLSQT